ncbi:MAG: T9SS type A sorting domain-containing protein [Bacteroidetes bacterium]|nr:T9SS type A sorting domain-containing protein [Bacteroidota bacterium]
MKTLLSYFVFILLSGSLNAQLVQEWSRAHNPLQSTNNFQGYAIKKAFNNAVYSCGYFSTTALLDGFYVCKYDSLGTILWQQRITTAFNCCMEKLIAIETDSADNVYVAGYAWAGSAWITILYKYNQAGVQQWSSIHPGKTISIGFTECFLKVDNSLQTIYIACSSGNQGVNDFYLAAVSLSGGTIIWSDTRNVNVGSYPLGLYIDKKHCVTLVGGSIYILSSSEGPACFFHYSPTGVRIWQIVYNSSQHLTSIVNNFFFDENTEQVYACLSGFRSGEYEYHYLQIDTAGTIVINRSFGIQGLDCHPKAISTDNLGNVILTGTAAVSTNSISDLLTVMFDPYGNILWTNQYTSPIGSSFPHTLITGSSSHFYVCEPTKIHKFSNSGSIQWSQTISQNYYKNAVELDISNYDIYVTGNSFVSQNNYAYRTSKYRDTTSTILSTGHLANECGKINIFPNPAENVLTIKPHLPFFNLTIKIIDLSGRELINETYYGQQTATISLVGIPKGIYLITIDCDEHLETKKLTVMK